MSRVGLKKIAVPNGVAVKVSGQDVSVKGPKGEITKSFHPDVAITLSGNEVSVSRSSDDRGVRSLHGLTRNEIQNMMIGVTSGYEKVLEMNGVGYRATLTGRDLTLNIGFSHPIIFPLPPGIDAAIEKQTVVSIRGASKYLVGQVAADIRALKMPEPYKGKGIKYRGEKIIRKEGKTGK